MSVCAMFSRVTLRVAMASIGLAAGTPALAIDLGTLDTFQDQSVLNWIGGTSISNKPGGQGGSGDRWLQVDSNGNTAGAGSRLGMHNSDARWIGDYAAAGVTGVQFDVTNLGATNLELRLVLFASGTRWTSSQAVVVPAGAPWRTVTLPISQSDLTRVLGSNAWADSITNVSQLMIRHDPGSPSSGGAAVDATAGFDNIRAVPAPSAAVLLLLGSCALGRRSRSGR